MPFSLPFSTTNAFGERLMTISTCSSSASSSSQAEALKNWRGLRAITFTFFAPRRSEVRQQSMAVLPTPMISTFSPMDLMCSKATDSSQVMPMWMLAAPSARPGSFSSLPLGAPEPTNTASKPPLSSNSRMRLDRVVELQVHAHVDDLRDLVVQHLCGRRNEGMLVRIRPPGSPYCSKIVTS